MSDPEREPGDTQGEGVGRGEFLKRAAILGVSASAVGGLLAGPALGAGKKPSAPAKRAGSVHDRLNRISHWDLNVSNLERSRAWYEAVTPLRVVAETSAEQAFPSLGIRKGSFNGYMMRDRTQPVGFPMIHLVEWKTPKPVGRPYRSHGHVGHYRIVPQVSDIAAARRAVLARGSKPFQPTTDLMYAFSPGGEFPYKVFGVHDPDGITLEFSGAAGAPITPNVIGHNSADVDRYLSFYTDDLGLDFVTALQTPSPAPNVYSPGGGMTEADGCLFRVRGSSPVMLDWLEWSDSRTNSTPYQRPTNLGIMRCSIEVDDVAAAFTVLRRSPWAKRRRIILGPPEEWNLGPQLGTRTVLNFTDPEGVGFQFIQQPPMSPAKLHPWGVDSFPTSPAPVNPKRPIKPKRPKR